MTLGTNFAILVHLKWSTWPIVPEADRPKGGKVLPYSCEMTLQEREELEKRGWKPLDVRLLPNDSDGERAACLKYWLEGMRLGTVECSASVAKYVEIEARVYGLTSGRVQDDTSGKPKGYEDMDFSELLGIGGGIGHPTDEKQLEAPPLPVGRPPGLDPETKPRSKPKKKKSRKRKKI